MNSLLSWDDMEEDTPIKQAVNQDAALRAAENLKNLDTTEAEKELAQQKQSIEHTQALKASGLIPTVGTSGQPLFTSGLSQEQVKAANQRLMDEAKKIIQKMDASLESGGRVNVAEKFLLNCKADLNQLVPFKYPAFWSLYLTSCENHWMPAEMGLERSAAELNASNDETARRLVARLYFHYMYRKHGFSEEVLLNCYRIITNPEARQYILREAIESATITHALTDMKELFNPTAIMLGDVNISQDQWEKDKDTFKNRHNLAVSLTPRVRNFETITTGIENTSAFLEELVYLYFYCNWGMQIVPMYQLMAHCRNTNTLPNLNSMLARLIKDMQAQTNFITIFLSTAFDENPEVMTAEFKQRILDNFTKMYKVEADLASGASYATEALDTFRHYAGDFLSSIGISGWGFSAPLNTNNVWFGQMVESLQPHINLEAGLSGNGGSLGW